jgi:hypothetical protein
MNMVRTVSFCLLLDAAALFAGTSINYEIAPDTVDGGGRRGAGADYTIDDSMTVGGAGASAAYSIASGFAGQLTAGAAVPAPAEIVIEQPAGQNVNDGGTRAFGDVTAGSSRTLTFSIRNAGAASLTGVSVHIDGPDAARFEITSNPSPVVPAASSTLFTVRFTPADAGAKTAALHIASNDSDESPFDITLTGTGRMLNVDFDFNSFRFTGTEGRDLEVSFNTVLGDTYRLLASPSMLPGTWIETGISVNGTGTEETVTLPNLGPSPRLFFRVVSP